jgi:hypothetical protein
VPFAEDIFSLSNKVVVFFISNQLSEFGGFQAGTTFSTESGAENDSGSGAFIHEQVTVHEAEWENYEAFPSFARTLPRFCQHLSLNICSGFVWRN